MFRTCGSEAPATRQRLVWLGALGTALVLVEAPARAAFVTPTLWARGQASTTYQEWDRFTSAAGPNAPDVGAFNPNGTSTLSDASAGSILTGSGNIYSFSAPLEIAVSVPDYASAGNVTTVILQTRTIGTEIDASTLNIGGLVPVDRGELLREPFGGPGGVQVETWFKFHLPYSAASFAIEFKAAGSSMSFDRAAVDTITAPEYVPEPNPVPEPTTAAMLAVAGLALARPRRRAMEQ